MEIVKKHGVKILAAIALIALFLPMASIEVGVSMFGYSASQSVTVSGMDVAFVLSASTVSRLTKPVEAIMEKK